MTRVFNPNERERRRRRRRARRRLAGLVFLLAVGSFGYAIGVEHTDDRIAALRAELDARQARIEALEAARRETRAGLAALQSGMEAIQAERDRLQARAPEGAAAALLARIETHLAAGVPAARLERLLAALARRPRCAALPDKRLIPRTPYNAGDNDTVSYLEGQLRIQVSGRPAEAPRGAALARFDPAQPATVRLDWPEDGDGDGGGIGDGDGGGIGDGADGNGPAGAASGGSQSAGPRPRPPITRQGQLPMTLAVLVGAHEIEITLAPGDGPGMASLSARRCALFRPGASRPENPGPG